METADLLDRIVLCYHYLVDVKQTLGQLRRQWGQNTIYICYRNFGHCQHCWNMGAKERERECLHLAKTPGSSFLSPDELGKTQRLIGIKT